MPWDESDAEMARARAERPELIATPLGTMVGLYTPAAPTAPAAGRCVVLFTPPRSHRNRMWVEAARRLAAAGFSAFRFDYHGTGDSDGASGYLNPNRPYREDAIAVIRHLRERLGERCFVLVGSCFDARTALSAFMDEADAIDGLLFMAAPLMELDTLVAAGADRKDWKHLVRSLRNPGNWRALASAERWRYMATVVSRVARRALPGAGDVDDTPLSESFVTHFRALVRSNARALFLYGRDDAEYPSFEVAERTVFAALPPSTRTRFETEVWPGAVHGFLEVPRQREAMDRCLRWIESFHPHAAAAPKQRPRRLKEPEWTST
jgi:pimeloyl-ACP methyl ester carboxylesterase